MKKLSLFFFGLGLSAALGYAHASGDPACYESCDTNFDACLARGWSTPAVCTKVWNKCYEACDYEPEPPTPTY